MEVNIMRIGEYLEIGNKMKTARMNAAINQRSMAKKLQLTYSTYSNYENGYSEPPMEIILKFCDIIGITVEELFGMKLNTSRSSHLRTFSEFLEIIIDLDRRGLPITGLTTYSQKENQLIAHLTLDIKNAQIATFIPDWNKVNQQMKDGLMDDEEYEMWLEDTLKLFNVPIDEYLYKS